MASVLSIPELLRRQAEWCERLGSPLYAQLLSCCAEDYAQCGTLYRLLRPHEQEDESTALPLRLMGAIHRLVLEGRAPELAAFFPSASGDSARDAWPAFLHTIESSAHLVRDFIERPVQTNEVGRSGSLFPGFALVAKRTAMPLRLLEIGASAGLNLRWDCYRYDWAGGGWGNPASAVRLRDIFASAAPDLRADIRISERAGCDLSPLDASTTDGRLTLLSYVWADQVARVRQLDAAIEIAKRTPTKIDKASAAAWLVGRLNSIHRRQTTVVFHSVMWEYLARVEQEKIVKIMEEAGERASVDAPLAWLRLEPNENRAEIRLRIYPGFEDRVIATTRAHAPSIKWLLGPEEN
jgi:hypothetical protein